MTDDKSLFSVQVNATERELLEHTARTKGMALATFVRASALEVARAELAERREEEE
jgi:uncharacterized protein (DUF1778 family)